jgi:divinyl protochlorophyllide a 8-vinyl-reductase
MSALAVTCDERHGRIGPNAVLQLSAALLAHEGELVRARIFRRASLTHHLNIPPSGMVDEAEVAALFAALAAELPAETALSRAGMAGAATARYLMAHRIPPLMRRLLPEIPSAFAAILLTQAIQRHGWTFLGSGALAVTRGRPLCIRITLAAALLPVAPLIGEFYRACFEGLFRALVSPDTHADPRTAPEGHCEFEMSW